MVKRAVPVGAHDEKIGTMFAGGGENFVGGQAEAHGGLASQTARLHLLGQFLQTFTLDALLGFEILPDAETHHFRVSLETRHLRRRFNHVEQKERGAPPFRLFLRGGNQPPLGIAEIDRNQDFAHRNIFRVPPPAGQREMARAAHGHRGPFVAGWQSPMRVALYSALMIVASVPLRAETPAEILQDEFAREELGVNELTAPSIQRLFTELEVFTPVPVDLIASTDFDRTYSNRFQTSLNFGSLICDGFFAVVAEQKGLIQNVGRALLRQAKSLAVGQRLSTRANSLLELGMRGDWAGLKLELIKTQVDVEEAMVELRDEEMAHMISLGGWLRGFEIGCIVTAENYSPQRAAGLMKPDVMDYFLDRLSTLNPRLKNTELVAGIISRLETIRKIAGDAADRAPSKSEVDQMRDLAVEINKIMSAPVNQDGQIVKKD